eukprot:TRINITY_DN918_c0_g1_i16.p2 TRINITY_DN918_c0_g1~~TRINITY_DN918_c0_g1_i16.p2  ORF type:complete len:139 (+),score=13.86 TRINITY_DN918_c0_g1_i16:605-1021(+)
MGRDSHRDHRRSSSHKEHSKRGRSRSRSPSYSYSDSASRSGSSSAARHRRSHKHGRSHRHSKKHRHSSSSRHHKKHKKDKGKGAVSGDAVSKALEFLEGRLADLVSPLSFSLSLSLSHLSFFALPGSCTTLVLSMYMS